MIPVLGYHRILAWLPYKQGSHVFSNIPVLGIQSTSVFLTVWVEESLHLTSERIQDWWGIQLLLWWATRSSAQWGTFYWPSHLPESSSLKAGSGEPRALGVSGHSELRESQGCTPARCEDLCLSVEKLIWPCGWHYKELLCKWPVRLGDLTLSLQYYNPFFPRQVQESLSFFTYNQRKP